MPAAAAEILKRSAVIPSMPQVVTRFLEIVQDPDFDYHDVVDVLSADPGTAGEILRLANSSLFGVTRRVGSLVHAMALLGLRRVRSLVLGRYIVESIDKHLVTHIDTGYFWRRSLTTAGLAGHFAGRLAPNDREDAFISGLLADVGVIVLDEVFPDEYAAVTGQYRPGGAPALAVEETARVGMHHGQASALVLEHWLLPETVCQAVRRHPWELEDPDAPILSRLVGAADAIARLLGESPAEIDQHTDECMEIARELGLDEPTFSQILLDVEAGIDELARTLHLATPASHTILRVAHALRDRHVACGAAAG